MKRIVLLLFLFFLFSKPTFASDNWKSLPQNSCPSYPLISACNLSYIMETNISLLRDVTGGASKTTASGISFLYKVPPVSGHDYLAYMGGKFHVPGSPTTAYAADGGIGYNSMTPVLKIWVAMRNLAYLGFAIVFVIIGVMILVRSKIDPKTTINIQNALPKIILSLVVVTFSYAIAGFLIDIMYVSLGIIVGIFNSLGNVAVNKSLEQLLNGSIFEFVTNGGWWSTTTGVATVVANMTYNLISPALSGAGGAIAGLIAGGLGFLIIGIAILWALFKTWLALISAYANVILGIILSPIQLMADALPGQNQLEGWIRTMLANLLAFPAVVAMLAIGNAIVTNFGTGWDQTTTGFIPPLMGVGDMGGITALVGLGILLTIPKTVEMLQEILKAPKQKFGSAWGEAMKASTTFTPAAAKYGYASGKWVASREAIAPHSENFANKVGEFARPVTSRIAPFLQKRQR